MQCALVSVVETPAFARRAEKLLSPDERAELITFLAENPEAGDEIPGTGGVRKVRFAAKGKGEQANLTPDQTKAVAGFAAGIKATAKARRTT